MIKEFKHKGLTLKVKTTMLKYGLAYFANDNIKNELEAIYTKIIFEHTQQCPADIFVIEVYKALQAIGIAPYEVTKADITYTGIKMSEFKEQTTLEK